MEKRKVFKISIIDKEISRTEFDRNTFYTSDSELSLVFKLIEKDYTYEHGEILLYNEDDKSFVTRQITKIENDFFYELDSDIIPHHGTWKAQLQLIKEGDVYTSKPFEFSIVNDLSNLAPQPTLTDINNWSTLKKNAAELIEEMNSVIDDVEHAESERASKENLRQQGELERVSKENLRQQGELERVSKENSRQRAESEREDNEKQRRSAEFERVDKEKTRQQAETQRATAESSRASAEEQRKIDHANRSAELDGKANKQQEDWITPTLVNGWENVNEAQPLRFMKDDFGFVHIQGRIRNGNLRAAVFTLPIGYGPSRNLYAVFPNGGSSNSVTKGIIDTYRRLILYNDNNDIQVDISFKGGD